MKVLVKWKKQGQLIIDGRASARGPGDEDIVDHKYAKSMENAGKVVGLGVWEEFAHKRSVAKVPEGVMK